MSNPGPAQPAAPQAIEMDARDQQGFYKVLFNRRDVRGQFKPDPVPDEVLARVLYAAHHAPSVGFMQPWNFMLIRDAGQRQRVQQCFAKAHAEATAQFAAEKQQTYRNMKLEGIVDAPLNICITCDRQRTGSTVIGRTHIPSMDLYSSVCAVQNLWLAARAEGLGVGWVSIFNEPELKEILAIPDDIIPIAYLCVGYVTHFNEQPDLQASGWLPRMPLDELVFFETWGGQQADDPLLQSLQQQADFPQSSREP